jgi:hypothetical protein
MNRKNRIRGLIVCLVLVFSGMILQFMQGAERLGIMLVLFSGGYALREILEGEVKE